MFETFNADTGSYVAAAATDEFNIVGGTGISTSITGSTLTITNTGGGGGEKTAFNPKIGGGGSDLAQQPVSASSKPEMIVHNNFDADNPYRDSNASLLGIFAV